MSHTDFDRVAGDLVRTNKARLFPGNHAAVEILDVALSEPTHFRWGCFHRWAEISYRCEGLAASMKMWLKFGPQLDTLFPTLAAYDGRLGGRGFPRPYFAGRSPDSGTPFLATAYLDGKLLRDEFLRCALLRRTGRLIPLLRANGAKMRDFHDAFPATETIAVADMVGKLTARLDAARHFSPPERERIAAQLIRRGDALGVAVLPAIRTHNDWVLRNIIVTADGTDYVIDNQDLHSPANWRWSDVALLLLNLEVQLKWFPLTTRRMMSRLWQAFWDGDVGEGGGPDRLEPAQLAAALYLVRLEWLIDGVIRQPYLDVMGHRFNRHLRRRLKDHAARGEYTLLDFACGE